MEVMACYKQTEMGVIPEDWNIAILGNISVISRLAGAEYTSLWVESNNGEIIALRGFNIGKGKLIERDLVTISNALSLKLKRSRLCSDDVIYPCVGSIGNAVVIEEDNKYHIQQNIARITPNQSILSSRYLANYLMSFLGQKEVARFNASSSQPSVLVGSLRQYRVPLPKSKIEQEVIAGALSDADALIESLENLIEKKRQIKQGAMQELLTGKKRLAGFSGEWEVKRLLDSCQLITKGTTPTSLGKDFTESGINFIKVESLNKIGEIIEDMVAYIDEETHELLKRSQLRENDLLISIAGALGRAGIVDKSILPANTNQALAIARFRDKSELFNEYVYYFIGFDLITKHIAGISAQGAQANLSLEQVGDFPIFAPKIDEQKAIVGILKDMDFELTKLESKLLKARQVKQGMMQELLTGKIRLV